MIKVQDLRIGNFVKCEYQKGIHKVVSTSNGLYPSVYLAYCGYESESQLIPIPLTPERLTKYGFMLLRNGSWYFPSTDVYVEVDNNNNVTVNEDYTRCIHCSSVHELQNKYWAVTGEELKVDIDKL